MAHNRKRVSGRGSNMGGTLSQIGRSWRRQSCGTLKSSLSNRASGENCVFDCCQGPVPKVRDPCVDFQCRGGYEIVGRVYSDEITPTAGVTYEGTHDAQCRL